MSFFKENLRRMDFDEGSSLLFVADLDNPDKSLTPAEVFALEDARKFEATAVYFRHFQDGRTPIPQIYIYDSTNDDLDKRKTAEIHRDLWSYCRIPMFIVVEKTDVKIFDARQPVKLLDNSQAEGLFHNEIMDSPIETSPIDKFKISDKALKEYYSRKLFDSGVFWESEKAKDNFSESTSAYRDLIVNLEKVRKDFISKTTLPEKTANKLLVFSILIKYLEERGNENESLFAHDFFQKLGAENFVGILRQKGKIIRLSDELSRHFNGRIFEWTKVEKQSLKVADLSDLANFLDGDSNLETKQLFLDWRKYSFNHLPVELISSVYEEFLNERSDAVYTPEFLVNTLIDESMPQADFKKTKFKTIDISCGSGIFLVSAFKRLAQRHRYADFVKTGNLKNLKSKKLLEIIKENIFGVDIEEDAIRLTAFSLCLALCDELTPKEIWEELKFDKTFEDNFKAQNFFDYLETEKEKIGTFDLVIGNPPFIHNPSLEINNKEIYSYKEKKRNNKLFNLNKDITHKIKQKVFPQNQIALMILDQTLLLLKENSLLCLIMPSKPLLYNTEKFRSYFFPKHQVLQILDFTNLKSVLYRANVPTVAIFVRKQKYRKEKPITHITIRRTKSIEERIFFEIDKYDFHYVSQEDAVNNNHIWKCNLLGGGRLSHIIERLKLVDTIENFCERKDWFHGEGYIESNKGDEAEYLSHRNLLEAKGFTEKGIDRKFIIPQGIVRVHRKTKKEIFQSPHILIKENIGKEKIPILLSNENLIFKQTIIGISSNEKESLVSFLDNFKNNNNIYRFFISATSSQYLVDRMDLTNSDIMSLPYSEVKEEMRLSYVEQIICDDVLKYQIEMLSKGSKAEVNWKKASKNDLEKFGEVFSKALNSVYEETDKSFHLKKIYDWGEFYITEFNYGEKPEEIEKEIINELTEHIESLVKTKYNSNVFLTKILKLYELNKVYFIKPKTLRYWLRSIAVKDADEVFYDSIKTELATSSQ
ncbi:N-6 DNA methylase [soil metagenome]